MRKLALLAGVIAVFILGAALVIMSIDTRALKTLLVDKVKARTGQTLYIEGPLRWGFYHGLQLQAGPMHLSSPAGYQDPYILQANRLSLSISLPALFNKELLIKRVQLDQAQTALEISATGVSNWDALLDPTTDFAQPSHNPPSSNDNDDMSALLSSEIEDNGLAATATANTQDRGWRVSLRSIRINDGALTWRKGLHQLAFEHINMMLSEPQKGRYPVEITSQLQLPTERVQLSYQGQLSINQDISILSLTDNQLLLNLQSTAQPERESQQIDGRFSLLLDRREGKLALSNIRIDSPIVKLGGELIVKTRPAPGFIDINLNSPYLDLDEVLPLWRDLALSVPPSPVVAEKEVEPEIVDEQPISSDGAEADNADDVDIALLEEEEQEQRKHSLRDLYHVDGFATLRIDQIRWRQQPFQHVSLDATIQKGVVEIDQFSMQGLGGNVSATGKINLLAEPTTVSLSPVISHMPLSAVMRWLNTGFNVRGMFNAAGRWQFSGWPTLKTSTGFLSLQASDVAFDGINLSYLLSSTVQRLRGKPFTGQQITYTTHFQRLMADLNLQNGQIKVARFNAQDDKLLVNATGTLDWATKQCQLQINNRLDLGTEWAKLSIPLQVYGHFDDLRYRIDTGYVLKQQWRENKQHLLEKIQQSDKLTEREKKLLSEL